MMKYYLQYDFNENIIGSSTIPISNPEFISKEVSQEEYKIFLQKQNEELELQNLRQQRQDECFSIINRGKLWYDNLTEEQLAELQDWYHDWLTLPNRYGTDAFEMPIKPKWLV